MDLRIYVENLQRQLAAAAEAGGGEARDLAERLLAPLDAAMRLTLQDALTAAAEEVTRELAPGSVQVRLSGRDLEFAVTPPPAREAPDDLPTGAVPGDAEAGNVARINLRLPDQLKARVEQAADREGLSINSWLVRAAAAAVERADPERRRERPAPAGAQHYTGWTR